MTESIESTAEELDTSLEVDTVLATRPVPALAVTPTVKAAELVERLSVIREAMTTAMQSDIDYGVIPGTDKPTLYKPGAEKLGVLFQLDVQLVNEKRWGPEDHLTVISHATVYHFPTGARLGYGEGVCSTRERKYGKRKQERVCPACGAAAVIKGKQEFGGGWLCWKKRDGCGAKYADGDPQIADQPVGDVENPDLPDMWNTVTKMAEKRARVDAVLAVTGASALFTQDAEDIAPVAPPAMPIHEIEAANLRSEVKRLVRRNKVKTAELRRMLQAVGVVIGEGESPVPVVDGLSAEQATPLIEFLSQGLVPTGESDVPSGDPPAHPPDPDPLPERDDA